VHASDDPPPPVWVIGPTIDRAEIRAWCQRIEAMLLAGEAGTVICDVGTIDQPDIVTIELLARLQLTAQRSGGGIQITGAHPRLRELITLVGLAAALPLALAGPPADGRASAGGLPVEPSREPEQREQSLGVEEVVDPADSAG
jgi:ABC-type transporter Mla MlaB component